MESIQNLAALCAASCLAASSAAGEIAVLYDPDIVPETAQTLVDQDFERLSSDIFNQSGFYSLGTGWTDFDSGPGAEQIATFYTHGLITGDQFHDGAQTLDRMAGFRVSFDLAIDFESHDATVDLNGDGVSDSAGFSLAVMSSDDPPGDPPVGVGIQFWDDRVWATDAIEDTEGETLLVQAEGIDQPTATMATLRRYDIEIKGDAYRLRADGVTLFTGLLRDYTGFAGFETSFGTINNFDKPNSITLGDAQRTAHSRVRIGDITSETPYQPTAEPGFEIEAAANGDVVLRWGSAPGLIYSLRSSETMETFGEFTDPVATRFESEYTDVRPRVPRRFYKIAPQPAP